MTIEDKELIERFSNLVYAVKKMRAAAIAENRWYTFVTCEYGEDVDDCLEKIEGLLP